VEEDIERDDFSIPAPETRAFAQDHAKEEAEFP
jgi:hypothetical protein